jgi:GT2 family glycosyltransferase
MAGQPTVTIVIPSWNGKDDLAESLPSITAQKYPADIVVVDNGSTDGSVEYLKDRWPEVAIVALKQNTGFTGACNRGIEAASGELVALVNNDVELPPAWLGELVAAVQRHPDAASVCGKVFYASERDKLEAAGCMASWHGQLVKRGERTADTGQYDTEEEVLFAYGAAALFRRSVFLRTGGFDDSFFAYQEEADWGIRAQLAGWSCWYVPTAVCYHYGGTTSQKMGDFARRQSERNNLWLITKDYPLTKLFMKAPKVWLFMLDKLFTASRDGWLGTLLKAWGRALLGMPRILLARRQVRRTTLGRQRLDRLMSDNPLHQMRLTDTWRQKVRRRKVGS